MSTYVLTHDSEHPGAYTLTLPADASDALRASVKALPGATWDGTRSMYALPGHRRTARALRGVLASPEAQTHTPNLAPDVIASLRAIADTTDPVADVTLSTDGETTTIRITTPHTNAMRDDLKRTAATWENDAWVIGIDDAAKILAIASKHDLVIHPDVQHAAENRHGEFAYDHTIDGLRGVPVAELAAVPTTARGKQTPLADRLHDIGIDSVYDLLMTVPRRYLDRTSLKPIADLEIGADVGLVATVTKVGQYDRQKRLVRHTVSDDTGSISITFFSSPWQAFRFKQGDKVAIWGKLDLWEGGSKRVLQMTNPIMDPLDDDTALIVPIYPQSAKNAVTTWDLHTAAMEAVRRIGKVADPVPASIIESLDMLPRSDALREVHHPDTISNAETARRRLAFDEFLRMQLALLIGKYALDDADNGVHHNVDYSLTKPYMDALPYKPTGAQTRALTEIRADLMSSSPMHRLLQGDVGSGKTTVAAISCLMACEGGHQAAIMAPTEILAWQLYREVHETTGHLIHPDGRPVRVEFLSGKTKAKDKKVILAGLADGSIDILVGTHALLTPDVEFTDLGLVVIDEQHRFGVEQRAVLKDKTSGKSGLVPDMLVMTATPIPRTAAMTVYGDLDLTILDELPPGRTPIVTEWVRHDPVLDSPLEHPWDVLREQVAEGRQAYVVCPLVEESEKLQAASATETYEQLRVGALEGLRVGLVHGQMPSTERDETMAAFKAGELDAIVATTVIEVGVNVPNATIMVILDAPRFGLAQLHQLRGRVGRGAHASSCFLVGNPNSADGVERMKAMVRTTSGFDLSEVDARLRGVGSVYGARQAGRDSDLRVGDIAADLDIIVAARKAAQQILAADRTLMRQSVLRNEVLTAIGPESAAWLTRS